MSEDTEDEYFESFLEDIGNVYCRREVPVSSLEKYKDAFPPRLLKHWENYGWTGYGDGIFWTVNPGEYENIIQPWLLESGIEQAETFHVIARNAFGDLYLWQEKTCIRLKICSVYSRYHLRTIKKLTPEEADIRVLSFFLSNDRRNNDFDNLFEKALHKLGPLQPDEMYGFVPALVLGGPSDLKHLEKVKTIEHLAFLSQLAPLTDWGFPEI